MNSPQTEGTELVQAPELRTQPQNSPLILDEQKFVLAQRQAVALSKADIIPEIYKNKPANVMIALELAHRLNCSPLMVMQNLYIVKGKPSFSGQFLIGLINASPRFSGGLRFEITGGPDAKAKNFRIRAWSISKMTGERCNGPWVDWPMVEGEGWLAQNPKWKNMPELMFHYRVGSFFARVFAPEISLGLLSREELEDLHGQIGAIDGQVQRTGELKNALLSADKPAEAETLVESTETILQGLTFAEAEGNLRAATKRDDLDGACDLVRLVIDPDERKKLMVIYEECLKEIERASDLLSGAGQ